MPNVLVVKDFFIVFSRVLLLLLPLRAFCCLLLFVCGSFVNEIHMGSTIVGQNTQDNI